VSRFDSDVEDFDAIWAYRIAPSMTLSARSGRLLFEPTVAFGSRGPSRAWTMRHGRHFNPSFALKYRGEKFRPQLNFAYVQDHLAGHRLQSEDGVISVGRRSSTRSARTC
jgi:hypothetical protein